MKFSSKSIKGLLLLLLTLTLIGTQIKIPEVNAADPASAAEEAPEETRTLDIRLGLENLTVERETAVTADTKKLVEQTAKIAQYVNNIFNPAIHFFTFKIGALLNNDYVYAGNMGTMLQNIWRVNRNIVNIVFVLILLFLALKQIVKGDENTDLKKILPTFAMMLIAINFSWLASKVVLDAAHVVTNITFSIPSAVKGVMGDKLNEIVVAKCGIQQTGNGTGKLIGNCQPTKIYMSPSAQRIIHAKETECNKDIDIKYNEVYPEGKDPNTKATGYNEIFGKSIYCWKTMDIGNYSQNTASYFLSFSMAKVQNLVQASSEDIGKLAIGSIMAFLIQLVYLVAFACLFIALILRIAALWFFVAFSPFIVLLLFMKSSNLGQGGELANKIGIPAFAHWAFAPAMVGAVWSVGFIMVTTGQSMSADFFEKLNETGEVTGRIFEIQTLFMGMENIQQFIWLLMSVGIIWIGTFAVLTKLSFGKEIFDYVNTAGRKFAGYVGKSPTWVPIIPQYDHKTGQFTGMKSLEKIADDLSPNKLIEGYRHGMTSQEVNKFTEAVKKLTTAIKSEDKQKAVDAITEGNVAVKFIENNGGITESTLRDMMKRDKDVVKNMLIDGLGKDRGEKLFPLIEKHFERTQPPPATKKPEEAAPAQAGAAPAAPAPTPPVAGATPVGGPPAAPP